jgi:hypothetical protein
VTLALLLNLFLAPPPSMPPPEPRTPSGGFALTVTSSLVTLHANKALLSGIARSLARDLGAEIDLSPALGRQRITVTAVEAPLTDVLLRLAPLAWMDVETDAQGMERVRRILLRPRGETPLAPPQLSQVLVIEGDTEDESVTSETLAAARNAAAASELSRSPDRGRPGFAVAVEGSRVSLRAREVPGSVLLSELAARFKVALNMQGADDHRFTLEAAGLAFESLPSLLALPGLTVVARRNLNDGSVTPLEIAVVPDDGTRENGRMESRPRQPLER